MFNKWQLKYPGMVFLVVIIFFILLAVIRYLWAWTVPDLFPGAVEQGLIAGEISWYASLKLAIIIVIFAGICSSGSSSS